MNNIAVTVLLGAGHDPIIGEFPVLPQINATIVIDKIEYKIYEINFIMKDMKPKTDGDITHTTTSIILFASKNL